MFLNNYKTTPKIKYMPLGVIDNQVLDPSWNGVTGATGEGFVDGFEISGNLLNGTSGPLTVDGVIGKYISSQGAVMRGASGEGQLVDEPGGQSGYMLATWWPYTPTSPAGATGYPHPTGWFDQNGQIGVGPQKIWKGKYYIPQGVLGRDVSGNKFPSNRYEKGETGRYDYEEARLWTYLERFCIPINTPLMRF